MTPKSEALAFRIWAYCEPRGWDVTVPEIARDLGHAKNVVGRVISTKGWGSRVRASYKKPANREKYDTMERLDFLGLEWHAMKRGMSDLANYT